jgi:hypothetical protein
MELPETLESGRRAERIMFKTGPVVQFAADAMQGLMLSLTGIVEEGSDWLTQGDDEAINR